MPPDAPSSRDDLATRRAAAYALLRREPDHRDAHLRLYEIEQMLGTPAAAVAHLRAALRASPLVGTPANDGRRTLLALSRVAPWEANTPLELALDETRFALVRLYFAGDESLDELLAQVPDFDVLFNSIAESDDAQHALRLAADLTAALGTRCLNDPQAVAPLRRDTVARRFAGSSAVVAPAVERVAFDKLADAAVESPLVVRPVGSQAGIGLERVDDPSLLRAYLERHPAPAYYVMPFVDYRSTDGFFRKYRIMFVAGEPLPCHLAISPRWMIHYYNAAMAEHAWMRDEEAAFLANLDGVFDGPRADALREIAAAVPLDYFGIDCSLLPDGRVLLFEADAAMLVHGTDPVDLYPYKPAAFRRIKDALTALLTAT